METSAGLGILIISLSGIFNGIFALPMKFSRTWKWENMWLVFSVFSLLILPGALAIGFVPHLGTVYSSTPIHILMLPIAFGLVLGIGQVLYGLGLASVGIAIAVAVVSGVSCVSGSLVPLIFLHPTDLFKPQGILLLVSIPILVAGLVFYSMAGRRRENEQSAASTAVKAFPWGFGVGLTICTLTGIFGSSINLGFAFSGGLINSSIAQGATSVTSTYAVWALLFASSFIPNLIYCSFLLFRNHTWSLFVSAGWAKETTLSVGMALLSFVGFIGYGIGATVLGKYGTSLGWAAFVAATIVTSTLLGLFAGEWRNTSQRTKKLLLAAVTIILLSVVTLDIGGIF